MKNSRKSESHQNKQGHVNIPKPDIRDDMDSRKGKEDNTNTSNPKKPVNANKPQKKPKSK
ncbi:MAG: hypothetical protein JST82_11750 [Bacteroidetes bacterium]|nr:hypothetical protein [Bacteroidota bacterium]